MNQALELGHALRHLPLESPPHSLWPELQAQLPKPTVWPKWPVALAASAAVLAVLLQFNGMAGFAGLFPARHTAAASDLAGIMDRSAQLENTFYSAQDDDISSATVIAANLDIEDRLNAIDSQLAAQPAAQDALLLWQQRVDLLNQGVALNRTNAVYNADGRNFDLALASLN